MVDASPAERDRVLAVTGIAREARIAAGPGIVAICCGANPDRLRAGLAAIDASALRAVVSFGLAGGLDPVLRRGNVVVATQITAGGHTWQTDPVLTRTLADALSRHRNAPILAGVAGADAPVMDAAAKAALHRATGAAAVDMESPVAAEFASAHRLPVGVVRVICDPASRALPALAQHALDAHGHMDLPAMLRGLARDPWQIAALVQSARDFATALASLRGCRRLLGVRLGLADLDQLVLDVA